MLSSDSASSRCLDAFIVVLNQLYEQERWYTSTKELQLASLGLCGACRNGTTLHLTLDPETPPRLLAAADASPPSPEERGSTRVPRLRAHTVTWNRSSSVELSRLDRREHLRVRPLFQLQRRGRGLAASTGGAKVRPTIQPANRRRGMAAVTATTDVRQVFRPPFGQRLMAAVPPPAQVPKEAQAQ